MSKQDKKKKSLWPGCTEQEKEAFAYYRELGYDAKTSEVLARFPYGSISFRETDINKIYDMLHKGMSASEIALTVNIDGIACGYKKNQASTPYGRLPFFARRRMREQGMRARDILAAEGIYSRTGYIPPGFLEDYELLDDTKMFGRRSVSKSDSGKKSGSVEAYARSESAETYALPTGVESIALPDCVEESCMTPEMAEGAAMFAALLAGNMSDIDRQYKTRDSENIEEKGQLDTMLHPTSTFRMTTNTASIGMIRKDLNRGLEVDKSIVRIEELLNDFRYTFDKPSKEMFSLSWEMMNVAEKPDVQYLMLGAQGKISPRKRQNIVILLDVSGSMSDDNKCTQAVIATIVSKLRDGDIFSLVTYSSDDMLIIDGLKIRDENDILKILNNVLSIYINGMTNGSAGIETAYEIGKKHFIKDGNNQVILITDGDLNFGITMKGELQKLIEDKKKSNLFLSVIGTGLSNYRDDKLEVLAKNGNGVYRAVNTIADVRRSVFQDYDSLVHIIAKDVKGQVEFNPEIVESYRLLGFENRMIAHEDFKNDKVISEPFGSGGYGVALYELHMRKGGRRVNSELKYQTMVTNASDELATFQIRYKKPLEDESEVQEIVVSKKLTHSDNIRLAYVIYICAELLRGSKKISKSGLASAKKFRKKLGKDIVERNGDRLELLDQVLDQYERGK